ncbi:MAG: hypothetical protein WCC21_09810 [Candidatus Acidiferrales bacterium]
MSSEPDLKPDDEISGTNSQPLTTADLAASRARLRLGGGNNMGSPAAGSRSEPVVVVSRNPVGAGTATAARMQRATDDPEMGPLLPADDVGKFRERWENVQVAFVDEPRRAVEQADHLVAETMHRLAKTFAKERENLERQWDRGGEVSTEDLRLALRRYRTFFGRLMQV